MIDSIVKYPGGKSRELKYILPNVPSKISNYFEPFVGGGSVYFALASKTNKAFINDKSLDLMFLYQSVKDSNEDFYKKVEFIANLWKKSDEYSLSMIPVLTALFKQELQDPSLSSIKMLADELKRRDSITFSLMFDNPFQISSDLLTALNRKLRYLLKQAQKGKNITDHGIADIVDTAVKSAIYTYFRREFNELVVDKDIPKGERAALYLFIRQYAYSSMFRFSKSGNFNVPYGGKTYNKISLYDKLQKYKDNDLKALLKKTKLFSSDFEEFLTTYTPQKDDFLFLDPPYDTEFSTYDKNKFDEKEQRRLAHFIINTVKGNWMLIIKDTDLIREIYIPGTPCANNGEIYSARFDKVYSVNFKNRNNRKTDHLIITNYPIRTI